jgi:hypothetical protein
MHAGGQNHTVGNMLKAQGKRAFSECSLRFRMFDFNPGVRK